jgi:hypothetical protein
MDNRSPWPPFVVALAVLASAALAADRGLASRFSGKALEAALGDIREARALVERDPSAFGTPPPVGAQAELKTTVQQVGARHGLSIAYLSEGERDAGQGRREKQAVTRLVNAPHDKLVPYLAELERVCGNARVREFHLRPSREANGVYQEVEFTLARPLAVDAGGR